MSVPPVEKPLLKQSPIPKPTNAEPTKVLVNWSLTITTSGTRCKKTIFEPTASSEYVMYLIPNARQAKKKRGTLKKISKILIERSIPNVAKTACSNCAIPVTPTE